MLNHAMRRRAKALDPYAVVADHRQDLDQYSTASLGGPLPCTVSYGLPSYSGGPQF